MVEYRALALFPGSGLSHVAKLIEGVTGNNVAALLPEKQLLHLDPFLV